MDLAIHPSEKTVGPLCTQEISAQELFWIKRSQCQGTNDAKFPDDKEQLNLQGLGRPCAMRVWRIKLRNGPLKKYLPGL